MLIEAGFDIAFECPAPTPMLLQLNIHPSRDVGPALSRRYCLGSIPPDARLSRPLRKPGHARRGPGWAYYLLQPFRHPGFRRAGRYAVGLKTTPIADLPNETLLYLVSSRYCDSDKLADFAWSQFGKLPGGYTRMGRSLISCMGISGSTTWRPRSTRSGQRLHA